MALIKQLYKPFMTITSRGISKNINRMAGPVETSITKKLNEAFKPTHLEVINESYMHNVPKESEMHFKVVVVSDKFTSKSMIQRHRMIHNELKEEFEAGLHALSIVAKTAEQWEGSPKVPESPKCLGGAKF